MHIKRVKRNFELQVWPSRIQSKNNPTSVTKVFTSDKKMESLENWSSSHIPAIKWWKLSTHDNQALCKEKDHKILGPCDHMIQTLTHNSVAWISIARAISTHQCHFVNQNLNYSKNKFLSHMCHSPVKFLTSLQENFETAKKKNCSQR